jgi:hypothetical protein
MSLQVFAYNLKRVISIFGVTGTMKAINMAASQNPEFDVRDVIYKRLILCAVRRCGERDEGVGDTVPAYQNRACS